MKKSYYISIFALCLIPLLSSCASQQDVNTLKYHVRSINKKLEDMKVNTVNRMQQRQADSSGVMDEIQTELLQLKAKLEENAHTNRLLQEENNELKLAVTKLQSSQEDLIRNKVTVLDVKLSALDRKIVLQGESLDAIQQARVKEAKRRSKTAAIAADAALRKAEAAKRAQLSPIQSQPGVIQIHPEKMKIKIETSLGSSAKLTIASPKIATGSKPAIIKKPVAPVLDSYSMAQQKYRDGDFDQALALFERSISERGKSANTIVARYMVGECLFQKQEYDQAAIQYQQIITNYPGNPQTAKALLRQGEAFEQLSDNATAKIIYRKLNDSFSTTPEAATARQRMDNL